MLFRLPNNDIYSLKYQPLATEYHLPVATATIILVSIFVLKAIYQLMLSVNSNAQSSTSASFNLSSVQAQFHRHPPTHSIVVYRNISAPQLSLCYR